jgi:hypothetical protein
MITIEQARKIDPDLSDLSDQELEKVLLELHELASLALEAFFDSNAREPGLVKPN